MTQGSFTKLVMRAMHYQLPKEGERYYEDNHLNSPWPRVPCNAFWPHRCSVDLLSPHELSFAWYLDIVSNVRGSLESCVVDVLYITSTSIIIKACIGVEMINKLNAVVSWLQPNHISTSHKFIHNYGNIVKLLLTFFAQAHI